MFSRVRCSIWSHWRMKNKTARPLSTNGFSFRAIFVGPQSGYVRFIFSSKSTLCNNPCFRMLLFCFRLCWLILRSVRAYNRFCWRGFLCRLGFCQSVEPFRFVEEMHCNTIKSWLYNFASQLFPVTICDTILNIPYDSIHCKYVVSWWLTARTVI